MKRSTYILADIPYKKLTTLSDLFLTRSSTTQPPNPLILERPRLLNGLTGAKTYALKKEVNYFEQWKGCC